MADQAGVDVLHASAVDAAQGALGTEKPLSALVKDFTRKPVMAVGEIKDPATAEWLITSGAADLVALGRGLIADPDWVRKAATGRVREIVPFNMAMLAG